MRVELSICRNVEPAFLLRHILIRHACIDNVIYFDLLWAK